MKIVYVSGNCDFSTEDMLESGELKSLVEHMLAEGYQQMESSDGSEVSILEFGEIDIKFIEFVKDKIVDYTLSKMSDFFILNS